MELLEDVDADMDEEAAEDEELAEAEEAAPVANEALRLRPLAADDAHQRRHASSYPTYYLDQTLFANWADFPSRYRALMTVRGGTVGGDECAVWSDVLLRAF